MSEQQTLFDVGDIPKHTTVVSKHKKSGYVPEPGDIDISREGKWGNPFVIGQHGNREQVIAKYKKYLLANPELLTQLEELIGVLTPIRGKVKPQFKRKLFITPK